MLGCLGVIEPWQALSPAKVRVVLNLVGYFDLRCGICFAVIHDLLEHPALLADLVVQLKHAQIGKNLAVLRILLNLAANGGFHKELAKHIRCLGFLAGLVRVALNDIIVRDLSLVAFDPPLDVQVFSFKHTMTASLPEARCALTLIRAFVKGHVWIGAAIALPGV